MSMRLPESEHTSRPWRIHEIVPDFRVEDVWVFRTPGAGPDDFPVMLEALRADGGLDTQSLLSRVLFAVRWKLGAVFGWDDPPALTSQWERAWRNHHSRVVRLPNENGELR
jgi:hypothetical protein